MTQPPDHVVYFRRIQIRVSGKQRLHHGSGEVFGTHVAEGAVFAFAMAVRTPSTTTISLGFKLILFLLWVVT
ncbi:hypothetical protein DK37_10675 [Halomonas sp. SUBG004]|nr:hypothetical protein DK37_10675 [Halomonas sp. SUBG004]